MLLKKIYVTADQAEAILRLLPKADFAEDDLLLKDQLKEPAFEDVRIRYVVRELKDQLEESVFEDGRIRCVVREVKKKETRDMLMFEDQKAAQTAADDLSRAADPDTKYVIVRKCVSTERWKQ